MSRLCFFFSDSIMNRNSVHEYCYKVYLLTPWSRVLLEKLTGSAASQEIPRIFGTRMFITVPTSARHLSLSWAKSIQSQQPPPTSWRSILILSSYPHLGLPSCPFPQVSHLNQARQYVTKRDCMKLSGIHTTVSSHFVQYVLLEGWNENLQLAWNILCIVLTFRVLWYLIYCHPYGPTYRA